MLGFLNNSSAPCSSVSSVVKHLASHSLSNRSSEVHAQFSKQLSSKCLCIRRIIDADFENPEEVSAVFGVCSTLLSFCLYPVCIPLAAQPKPIQASEWASRQASVRAAPS